MEALKYITKTREYLDYIEEHILNVEKAWRELQNKCKDMRFIHDDFVYHWIDREVRNHDLSKLSEHELVQYRNCFYPVDDEQKGDMSSAWEHHKEHNMHHWESWTLLDDYDPYEKEVHCVHMVIDWMAMGYKFNDTAEEYYEKNKDRIKLPDGAIDFIYEIFRRLN